MPAADIDDVLSRFPGPVTLYPSRRRGFLFLVGSLAFVASSVWLLYADAVPRSERWTMWFSAGFFAFCAAVFVLMLLPRASKLLLDSDGFETTSLFRTSRIRWADTGIFKVFFGRMVAFYDARSVQDTTASTVKGFRGALPDVTPFSGPDLAALLNRWRAKALGSS